MKQHITSPTYLIVKEYETPHKLLVHADLYRVSSLDDVTSTGLLEHFCVPDTLSLVEWPERVFEIEAVPHLHISIEWNNDLRVASLSSHGASEQAQNMLIHLRKELFI